MKKRYGKSVLVAALTFVLGVYGSPFQNVAKAAEQNKAHNNPAVLSTQLNEINVAPGLNGEKAVISPNIDTNSASIIRVIVQLRNQPVAVGEYASKMGVNTFAAESTEKAIGNEQSSFVSKAKDLGINLKVNYQFNTVLNGMEISIPANQIPTLAKISDVKSVYENHVYFSIPEISTPAITSADSINFDIAPIQQIGAQNAWARGLTGQGLKVGVIDSGVDYLHPDLEGAYKGGHDSFFNTDDPYEEGPLSIEDDPYHIGFKGTYHGTHVSGTIVGRAANSGSDVVQKGIAYGADLYEYKVLGRAPLTGDSLGSTAQVIDGIEHAVKDGMDVINLSLGTDDEKDPNSPDAIAINNAVLAGVVAVIASGNAADSGGPYYYSMGSPASSQLAISVGAATSPSNQYTAHAVSSFDSNQKYQLNMMGWRILQENFAEILGAGPIEAVYVGLGKEEDYAGKDVAGKIAFVSRGETTFDSKITIAKEHGAKAIIIFNGNSKIVNGKSVPDLQSSITDRDGNIGSIAYLGDSLDYIPAFDMAGDKGRALANQVLANSGTSLQFTFTDFNKTVVPGDTMVSFSSRGPESDGNFSIKPDFVAPGANILSTWPAYGKYNPGASYNEAYKRDSGTSMATPHVTGLALLLKQEHHDWTPFDIRAALANTADEMKDPNGVLYDVYSEGAGRVNVTKAIDTPALLETIDNLTILDKNLQPQNIINYGDSASFGLMTAGSEPKTEQLQVKNTTDDTITYTVSTRMHSAVTSDPANPIATPDVSNLNVTLSDLSDSNEISVEGHSTKQFSLKVAPNANAQEGVYEGEVVLDSPNLPSLHLPFVVHVGTEDQNNHLGLQDMSLTNTVIVPNGEEEKKRTDVSVYLKADDVNAMALNVYGVDDQYIGTLDTHEEPDNQGNLHMLQPGPITFSGIDGSYIDGEKDADGNLIVKHLQDGIYNLSVNAVQLDSNQSPIPGIRYVAWKTFGVSYDDTVINVMQAKDQFDASTTKISNTTEIHQPVLTLPTTPDDITFQVTGSSNTSYIGNDGILTSLPSSGSVDVDLTVTIASLIKPSVKVDTTVKVTLRAAGGRDNGGGSRDRNSGKENIQTSPVSDNDPTINAVTNQGQERSSVKLTTQANGSNVIATISDADLQGALKSASNSPIAITLKVPATASQQAQVNLSASQLGMLSKSNEGSTVIVSTGYSSVALPVSIFKRVPANSDIRVTIHNADDQRSIFTAQSPETRVLATPVSYEVEVVTGKNISPISVSSQDFIKRSFVMDGKVDTSSAGVLFTENGKVYPVPATFTSNTDGTSTVTINRPGFSTYAVVTRNIVFTDIDSSWAKSRIQSLANKYLISGTSTASFSPKQNVTRAQFAAMLTRALGLQAISSAPFEDVHAADWFSHDVAAAFEAGLVSGVGNGKFNPDSNISRQELAVMLARASVLLNIKKNTPSHQAYTDSQKFASYAQDSIHSVTESGLMTGINRNGTFSFEPTAPTTREAAASVLYNLLQNGKLIN